MLRAAGSYRCNGITNRIGLGVGRFDSINNLDSQREGSGCITAGPDVRCSWRWVYRQGRALGPISEVQSRLFHAWRATSGAGSILTPLSRRRKFFESLVNYMERDGLPSPGCCISTSLTDYLDRREANLHALT